MPAVSVPCLGQRHPLLEHVAAPVCLLGLVSTGWASVISRTSLEKLVRSAYLVAGVSFALSDPRQLECLMTAAGFADVHVERQSREEVFENLDEYWAPIEAGTGSIPQLYLSLPERQRRAVRDEVTERPASFQSDGRLVMSVEMLVASGAA